MYTDFCKLEKIQEKKRPRARTALAIHVRTSIDTVRTVRSCEPLSTYMDAIMPYAKAVGTVYVFLATDSEVVLSDARKHYPAFTFLYMRNNVTMVIFEGRGVTFTKFAP